MGLGVNRSAKISGNFGTKLSPTGKLSEKMGHLSGGLLLPSRTSLKFVKWIAPIEIAIHSAVARVGEFVRDNASLGELRRDKEI